MGYQRSLARSKLAFCLLGVIPCHLASYIQHLWNQYKIQKCRSIWPIFPNIKEAFQIAITFFLAVIGWIIFRAESMTQAIDYLYCMINNPFLSGNTYLSVIHYGLPVFVVEWLQRDKLHALQVSDQIIFRYSIVRLIIYFILICATYTAYMVNIQDDSQFIYFQF